MSLSSVRAAKCPGGAKTVDGGALSGADSYRPVICSPFTHQTAALGLTVVSTYFPDSFQSMIRCMGVSLPGVV
ncbi:hypothetical protein [Methanoculleus bourgensis]|uniref:hypothetical protein n=1 Tax=Methanoculleus bourgensis TaxID=83986 RepID=UPI002492A230|nr:hypothetical protein [Methanoculleus bourgensis]